MYYNYFLLYIPPPRTVPSPCPLPRYFVISLISLISLSASTVDPALLRSSGPTQLVRLRSSQYTQAAHNPPPATTSVPTPSNTEHGRVLHHILFIRLTIPCVGEE